MSEQESDEAKRVKQLEEARKRVEELKKKKIKKSKGKKNKNSSVTSSVEPELPGSDDKPGEEHSQEQTEEVDSTKHENNIEDLEKNKDTEDTENKDIERVESDNSGVEGEETKEDSVMATPVEQDGARVTQKVEVQESTENDDIIIKSADVEKTIEPQEEKKESSCSPGTADDLFANDNDEESDFLTTIEKQKEEDELTKVRAELEELAQENKQLKFLNMDNETTVDDLQDQLQEKEDVINSLQNDLQSMTDELIATQQRLKEAEAKLARNSTPTPIQFADFNASSNNLTPSQSAKNCTTQMAHGNNAEVDRVMLDKWRHWNVDMTTWRSIGSGPIMEF
ncbi:hypothetical protein SMKI_04G1410 [Saccharomyces mikatae IFO 1815]|uniref:Bug1p n=1 Tax=Saccharomyces mikatae IFO 1815 TaxID=226126 RepID=A0AA35IYJ4_SACMI|nr:uncharacterized protein SMKI_04G1410 [Saccharomyces mikatae IFO 1815]CAI4037807.1 hypothetical protein SMKI_04G1410 [Saccharomyces mikatae IFO 1815]